MAWQARVDSAVTKNTTSTSLSVLVTYFDDTNPTVTLHQQWFNFDTDTATADMRAAIVGMGQLARRAVTKAAAINAQAPVGTLIAIP